MNKAEVVFAKSQTAQGVLALRPALNLRIANESLRSAFGSITSLEEDLLVMASSIFACDLAFKRGDRENFVRKISLKIPVVNRALLESVRQDITYAIYLLSHDAWNIELTQRIGTPETAQVWNQTNNSKVLLFSGGLDSFAAAADAGYSGTKVHLISHLTGNHNISRSQQSLFEHLQTSFPGQFARTSFRVGATNKSSDGYPFPTDQEREETQRTRSFLFLTLAGLAARKLGASDVIMIAENGQLAIHLPLTAARISAFSTHTAHPEFVKTMGEILSRVLAFDIRIENPFLYLTKGEVVSKIKGIQAAQIPQTISCWRSARMLGGYTHCGECVPCLVRRIANEAHGIRIDEYARDLFREDVASLEADDLGKRNFLELAEFVRFFFGTNSRAQIISSYPELINESIDANHAIAMYKRFASEAVNVFSNYAKLTALVR
ncbi:MAG: 7-cyano-7-deazaguanine synthase [Ignavibacteriae bacterium]|nr:7-cyano-7-deazaguanine synthase [Ignavibacteriota bacterium]